MRQKSLEKTNCIIERYGVRASRRWKSRNMIVLSPFFQINKKLCNRINLVCIHSLICNNNVRMNHVYLSCLLLARDKWYTFIKRDVLTCNNSSIFFKSMVWGAVYHFDDSAASLRVFAHVQLRPILSLGMHGGPPVGHPRYIPRVASAARLQDGICSSRHAYHATDDDEQPTACCAPRCLVTSRLNDRGNFFCPKLNFSCYKNFFQSMFQFIHLIHFMIRIYS